MKVVIPRKKKKKVDEDAPPISIMLPILSPNREEVMDNTKANKVEESSYVEYKLFTNPREAMALPQANRQHARTYDQKTRKFGGTDVAEYVKYRMALDEVFKGMGIDNDNDAAIGAQNAHERHNIVLSTLNTALREQYLKLHQIQVNLTQARRVHHEHSTRRLG